jgi:uncharacterized Zn finger protein
MGFYAWRPYVPVAARKANAAREAQKLTKNGEKLAPVAIEGRTIAKSFWGKSWCENLERYSDYENRLPRGRTYVRNGSVIDLKVTRGEITALVSGSEIYRIKITIQPVSTQVWKELCTDCAGSIDSLVELLQGRFSKAVMERVCVPAKGLFPSPKEIKLSCDCPDGARMCKHVAAVMYGVGARLDKQPEMLFTLRGVDHTELVAKAGRDLPLGKKSASSKRILAGGDLAALFGLDIAESAGAATEEASLAKGKSKANAKAAPKKGAAKSKTVAPVVRSAERGRAAKPPAPASSMTAGGSSKKPAALAAVKKPTAAAKTKAPGGRVKK